MTNPGGNCQERRRSLKRELVSSIAAEEAAPAHANCGTDYPDNVNEVHCNEFARCRPLERFEDDEDEDDNNNDCRLARTRSRISSSSSKVVSWLLLAVCFCSSFARVACSDNAFMYYNNNYNNYKNKNQYSYNDDYNNNDDAAVAAANNNGNGNNNNNYNNNNNNYNGAGNNNRNYNNNNNNNNGGGYNGNYNYNNNNYNRNGNNYNGGYNNGNNGNYNGNNNNGNNGNNRNYNGNYNNGNNRNYNGNYNGNYNNGNNRNYNGNYNNGNNVDYNGNYNNGNNGNYNGNYNNGNNGNNRNYNGNYNNGNNANYNGNYNNGNNGNNGNGNNDDANNDDANNNNADNDGGDDAINNQNYDYNYEAPAYDDAYNKQWEDDNIDLDVDGFDGVSIVPVSCVNFNNGHFIKFELYETENSYQCHFAQIGTFVVSIAHYMRAYFNYQALTRGNSFSLPDDVGYLNCIPLKMEKYGFESTSGDDDANADGDDAAQDEENGEEKEQAVLYAKVGCLDKETFSSNTFQLHVYTDAQCTNPYDDGQTDQQHASKGYLIDLDTYYDAKDDDDDAQNNQIRYTDYPDDRRTLQFSTKVSFRPNFYSCQSCKPSQISETFNKFSGTFYDDLYISQYGMTQSAYNKYLQEKAEEEAAEQAAAECKNCQYFHYSADDNVDDFNKNYDDASSNDDAQAVDDAYYNAVDDYQANSNYYNGNGGWRRTSQQQQPGKNRRLHEPKHSTALVPVQSELKKFESEFWAQIDKQLEDQERSLYENQYGGVDSWNICEQVYKYGLYCDEECQSLDAFKSDQWSGADIVLLSIMCTFMAAMVMLVVAKRIKTTRSVRKQNSFFYANDYDTSVSGYDTSSIPGLPATAMFTMYAAVMIIITALAFLNFVNETLVFAVVCCILLFIYMLKITLFSAPKRPVLLTSPNHEDVFNYSCTPTKAGGFFS